jgi:hypothetical protein
LTPAEANAVRWDQGPSPFYEVWYLIAVEPSTGDGFWVRYTLLNPLSGRPETGATAWFGYTCRSDPTRSVAITQTCGTGSFAAPAGGMSLRFAAPSGDRPDATPDCVWNERELSGAIAASPATGGHSASWTLRFTADAVVAHRLMPGWLRRFSDRRTALTIPYPRLVVDGEVTVDGRRIDLRGAAGHQAHHWGRARADAWDWAHCAHFEDDPDAVVEALAPHVAGGNRLTFVNLHLRDRVYRCERVGEVARNRSSSGLGWWRFVGNEAGTRIEAEFVVAPDLLLPFTYVAPSYGRSRCWNSQVADCLVRVIENGRESLVLRSRGKASAEMHRSRLEDLPYESWARESASSPRPVSVSGQPL